MTGLAAGEHKSTIAPSRRAFDVQALNLVDWRKDDVLDRASGRAAARFVLGTGCSVNSRLADLNGHNDPYFQRSPEKLVLEGYRQLMAGFETGSIAPWELTWALYEEILGSRQGAQAMGELSIFVRSLRKCASCPLRAFPFGAQVVSREECLTLGLVAGLQHGDGETAALCASAVSCPLRSGELAAAARPLAETLSRCELTLLPIPRRAIEDIMNRATRAATVH